MSWLISTKHSHGAVVARRSYIRFITQYDETLVRNADVVGSTPTGNILVFWNLDFLIGAAGYMYFDIVVFLRKLFSLPRNR